VLKRRIWLFFPKQTNLDFPHPDGPINACSPGRYNPLQIFNCKLNT